MAGNRALAPEVNPNRLGLGQQVADGQDDAVAADQRTVPDPLGAQDVRREGVRGNKRANADDGAQSVVQLVVVVFRLWLHDRPLPIFNDQLLRPV